MYQSPLQTAPERLYALGCEALSAQDTRQAQKCFGLMVAVTPLDERPWLGLGAAREQVADWPKGAGFYAMGLAVKPTSVSARIGKARCLGHLGNTRQALGLLDEAQAMTEQPCLLAHIEQIRGEL